MTIEFLLYPLLGVLAGLMAGLLGVGGGLIVVPALIVCFRELGFSPSVLTHMAVATSLATILLTSAGSILQHHRAGAVQWPVVRAMATGLVLGACGGAAFADVLTGRLLQQLFSLFACVIAFQLWWERVPQPSRWLPGPTGQTLAGMAIGTASALFGIGGGSLTVPYLVFHQLPMQHAVATSAACGFPIAFAGMAAFVWVGQGTYALPEGALGYVYMPAVAGIAMTSVIAAGWGARWAHRLPARVLKRIFALLLVAVGLELWRT